MCDMLQKQSSMKKIWLHEEPGVKLAAVSVDLVDDKADTHILRARPVLVHVFTHTLTETSLSSHASLNPSPLSK